MPEVLAYLRARVRRAAALPPETFPRTVCRAVPLGVRATELNAHRLGELGGHGALELEPDSAAAARDEQVELGAAMRGVEEAVPARRT